MIELLKAIGYPITSIIVLIAFAYIFRQFFQSLLNSVVQKDMLALKAQNSLALEEAKQQYKLQLEDHKSDLARQSENLKQNFSIELENIRSGLTKELELLRSNFSIEAETYHLAAQKRFECLLSLWESSESLFELTDFSDINSITDSLQKNDSYNYLKETEGLLITGPTGTNVMDIQILLVGEKGQYEKPIK